MFWAWKGLPGTRSLTKNTVWDSGNVNGLRDLTATRVAGFPKHWLWEGDCESRYSGWRWQKFGTRDSRQKGARMWNQGTGFPTLCALYHFIVQYSILFITLCVIAVNCTALLVFASHSIALNCTYFVTMHCSALYSIALRSTLLNCIG